MPFELWRHRLYILYMVRSGITCWSLPTTGLLVGFLLSSAVACTTDSGGGVPGPSDTAVVGGPIKRSFEPPGKKAASMTVESVIRAFEAKDWPVFEAHLGAGISPSRDGVLTRAREAAREVGEAEYQIVFDGVVEGDGRFAARFHWFRVWRTASDGVIARAEGQSEWHVERSETGYRVVQMIGDELW